MSITDMMYNDILTAKRVFVLKSAKNKDKTLLCMTPYSTNRILNKCPCIPKRAIHPTFVVNCLPQDHLYHRQSHVNKWKLMKKNLILA